MSFTFTQLKQLKEVMNDDFDNVRECLAGDFMNDDYRMIHEEVLHDVMRDELKWEPYLLGSFNTHFLANLETLDLDYDFIKQLQEKEAFEAIGELIIRTPGALEELVEDFISEDGPGPYFAPYDGNFHEVGDYFVFRIN